MMQALWLANLIFFNIKSATDAALFILKLALLQAYKVCMRYALDTAYFRITLVFPRSRTV